jgi:hypothetical protein
MSVTLQRTQVGDGLNAADLVLFEVYSGKVYKLPKMDEKMEFASVVTPFFSNFCSFNNLKE